MFNRFIKYGVLLTGLLFFAVACSANLAPAPASDSKPVPTSAIPSAAATASQSGTAVTTPTSAPSGTTARSLKEIDPTKVYNFQVVPEQTQASYSVQEVLLGQSRTTVGTTNSVQGQFQLGVKDGKPYISLSTLRVDLSTLKSFNSLRDEAIKRQWLESSKYPYADFVAKEVTDFPSDPIEGQDVHFKVTGDLTIRNITHSVTFDITAKIEGDTLTGTGTTLIYMKDFGFNPPDIAGRFTVSDGVTITVKGVAQLTQS